MPLEPPAPIDARPFFRPVSTGLTALLRQLTPEAWLQPTLAGSWRVRDVVAHMLDTTLRRLSFHRDGMMSPPPDAPIASDRDLAGFVNDLNAQWVRSTQRLSPRVLTDLYEHAAAEAADWYETLPLDGPALFPVSWAGEHASSAWFDLAREFTELWHHQQQIRLATGAAALGDPRYLSLALDAAMRGLPYAFRDVPGDAGPFVTIDVGGASGGQWTLSYDGECWTLLRGRTADAAATIRLTDDVAWKLLFNALSESDAAALVHVDGSPQAGRAFLRARSVVV